MAENLGIIYCTSGSAASDFSAAINAWWNDELNTFQQKDYSACIEAMRDGDTIFLAGHHVTKQTEGLWVTEH